MTIIKKVIVTGANGFIGSYLVKVLIDNNISVISIVRNESSKIELLPINSKNRIVYCDLASINNLTKLIPDRDIDVFYHLAWEGVSGQFRSDENVQLNNILSTAESVRVAKKLGCYKFVGAGSIMELETTAAVYTNGNRPGLNYIYGANKFAAHCISKSIAAKINIDHVWTLITNAYGPGELSSRLINTTLRKILNKSPLYFTAATQNYDFIYVTDLARAFYLIGLQGKPFKNYVVGSGKAKPLNEFIYEIKNEFAPNLFFGLGKIPYTGINLPVENFSIDSLKKDTKFKPVIEFKDGIRKTMNWLSSIYKYNKY